ncbi:MAG: FAD:protein FMN transferase [Clostridia bacterium]|nr:FAD:protein FMN transferase [Clostridia bacterium]
MKKIIAALLALTLIFAFAACGNEPAADTSARTATVFAMDTFITVTAYSGDETLEKVGKLMTGLDGKLSRTKADSDIGRLNASGTEGVTVGDDAATLLSEALGYCAESGGIFDITIAPVTELWNVTGDSPRVPSPAEIADAMLCVGYKYLTIDGNEAKFAYEGMSCDLGGIAKGYAADKAVDLLKSEGVTSAMLQVGSSIYLLGEKPDGSAYNVGIRDPEGDANSYVGTVKIKDKYITSSGDYERYFEVGGKRYCHIFDTASGYPIDNDLHSVTVITDNGAKGDYLSTLLFCLGLENGLRKCEEYGVSALFITKDKHIYTTGSDFAEFELTNGDYVHEK